MMSSIELSGLEYQVDHLLRSLQRLQTENAALRQKLANHVRERFSIIEKNQQAVNKIKKIVAQLREEI